jgi:hypothetical protein
MPQLAESAFKGIDSASANSDLERFGSAKSYAGPLIERQERIDADADAM